MTVDNTIKAIVFDFGNVIINIDLHKTYQAFADLTFKSPERIKQLFDEAELFQKFEVDFYSENEFRDVVRQTLSYPLNDDEIDKAWNALLLDIPKERVDYLIDLRINYPIYLLSNTNSIHIKKSLQLFRSQHKINDFRELFQKAYLSYEMKLWKPDYKIYKELLDEIGCLPEEMLFIDDNQDNIDAAKDLGIRCIKINPPESFPDILNKLF